MHQAFSSPEKAWLCEASLRVAGTKTTSLFPVIATDLCVYVHRLNHFHVPTPACIHRTPHYQNTFSIARWSMAVLLWQLFVARVSVIREVPLYCEAYTLGTLKQDCVCDV